VLFVCVPPAGREGIRRNALRNLQKNLTSPGQRRREATQDERADFDAVRRTQAEKRIIKNHPKQRIIPAKTKSSWQ
jgi:hypothetical protein